MMKKGLNIVGVYIVLLILIVPQVFAYENTKTHPTMTLFVIEKSNILDFLEHVMLVDLSDLDMMDEVYEDLPWRYKVDRIEENKFLSQISQGSIDEDKPEIRALNHFYNPINGEGLSGAPSSISTSSLVWATGNNVFDWLNWCNLDDATEYYEEFLTSSTNDTREKKLKKTLSCLGHIVHLIEDKAVPAHVRNDSHNGTWKDMLVNGLSTSKESDLYETYTSPKGKGGNLEDVDESIYTAYDAVDTKDFDTFSKFWDWNRGENESVYNDSSKGLAEYTAYNFVSKDTIYDDGYNKFRDKVSPCIAKETINLADKTTKSITSQYIGWEVEDKYKKTKEYSDKMAVASFFYRDLDGLLYSIPRYTIDDSVCKEQLRFLFPRAVGYAAGFLNYFFRGTFSVESTPLPLVDGKVIGYELAITNTTSFDYTDGTLHIMVDDANGNRRALITPLSVDIASGERLENPIVIYRADASIDSIPDGAPVLQTNEKIYGTVFYKGKIGIDDGIAAKVWSLVNICPILQSIDEHRRFSPAESPDYDINWTKYKVNRDSGVDPSEDIGRFLTTNSSEWDKYNSGAVDERILRDMRESIEVFLANRYWDDIRKLPWTWATLSQEALNTYSSMWGKEIDDVKDNGVGLEDIIEIEKCLLEMHTATQPIRFPGWAEGASIPRNFRLTKEGEDIQLRSSWNLAKADAEQSAKSANPAQLEGRTMVSGYALRTYDDDDNFAWNASLLYSREYGQVDTSGISDASDIEGGSFKAIVNFFGVNDAVSYPYYLYGSKILRSATSNNWELSGGVLLSQINVAINTGEDVSEKKAFPITVDSSLSTKINFGGTTSLMVSVLESDADPELRVSPSANFIQNMGFLSDEVSFQNFFIYDPAFELYNDN